MTRNHLTTEQIEQYRNGTASPDALLEMDDHIAACESCRAQLQDRVSDSLTAWAMGLGRFASQEPDPIPVPVVAAAPPQRVPWWMLAVAAGIVVVGVVAWQGFKSAPTPTVVASLNDGGGKITLDAAGQIVLPTGLSESDGAAIAQAIKGETVSVAAIPADLVVAPGTLLGPGSVSASFEVRAPLSVISFSDRPEFRWDALPGARDYEVSVYDAEFREIDSSGRIRETHWTPVKQLPRGALYQWQVTAYGAGREVRAPQPPAPEAKFRVLDAQDADKFDAAKASGNHLLAALLAARAGMRDETRSELAALQAANPGSALATKLASGVK